MEADRLKRPVRNRFSSDVSFALNERAMGRGRFPCSRIVHPGIAADHRTGAVRAADVRIIGELVVSDGGIRAERRYMHVADVATLPFVLLVLQLLDELILILPLTPAVPRDEAVGQVLLFPRHVVVHLCLGRLFLQLLYLLFDVAAALSINTDTDCETAEHDQ